MLDDALKLAPKEDVDYRNLSGQPTPEDFFLLSRIRGSVTVAQVISVSGLGRDKTITGLERLLSLGLLEAEGRPSVAQPPPAVQAPAPQPRPTPEPRPEPARTSVPTAPKTAPEPARVAEPVLEQNHVHESFAPVISEPDDDDLFEVDSPAHLSKLKNASGTTVHTAEAELFGSDDDDDDLFGGPPAASADDDDLFGGPPAQPAAPAQAKPEPVSLFEDDAPSPTPAASPSQPDFGEATFAVAWSDYELDESQLLFGPDLDDGFKREILYVYEQLPRLTYYDLLGVKDGEDPRKSKKTYIKLSKRFHPDVFYGKDAGEFGTWSEEIFKTVTKAFQTLSNPKKRAEYDATLQDSEGLGGESGSEAADENRRQLAFQTLVRQAYALEEQGLFSQAVNEYRRALSFQRDDSLLIRCATLLLHAGIRLDEAATYARAALEANQRDSEAWLLLGKIYERSEILDAALEAYEKAAECAPHEQTLLVHVERLRASLGY